MDPTPAGSTSASIRMTVILFTGVTILNAVMLWTFVGSLEDVLRQQQQLVGVIELTSQISQTLVTLPARGEELNHAVEQLRDALGLYHVQVFLADPVTGLAVLQASTGFIGRRLLEEESLLMPPETSPVNDALRRSDSILIKENDPPQQRDGFLPATRSQLLFPLRVGDLLPIGVLDLHSTGTSTFSKNVLQALGTIANQMAIALYSAQQNKELRSSYQERDSLVEQIDTTQRDLARLNRQLIGATWGTFLEERRDVAPGFEWQQGALLKSSTESEALGQTLADGKPRLEHRENYDVLCVPIRLRGQTLGAVEFRRSSEVGWSAAALELAQAVAERLALSLENARLFEQAQMTARREQMVSKITTQLQSTNDLQALLTLAASQFQDALGATHTQVRLGMPQS
jgi:GAF domain-containing protein